MTTTLTPENMERLARMAQGAVLAAEEHSMFVLSMPAFEWLVETINEDLWVRAVTGIAEAKGVDPESLMVTVAVNLGNGNLIDLGPDGEPTIVYDPAFDERVVTPVAVPGGFYNPEGADVPAPPGEIGPFDHEHDLGGEG